MGKVADNKAWFLVLPAVLMLTIVGVIPLITVFNSSFFDIFTEQSRFWVGTEWYIEILRSSRFAASFGRSLLFSAIILMIEIPLGIAIALALPKKGIAVPISLVVVSLPLLVPWNIIPIIWTGFLHTESGFLGQFLAGLGVDFNWKFNPVHTWSALILMDVWHWTSLVVLLCYSSLTTITGPYYQAAAIDGASRWQVFRYIELPKLNRVLMMAFLLRFMDSFMIYTEAFRFNAGGPHNATMFLAVDLGEDIAAFNYGPAAARSVIYFVLILTVTWAFNTALTQKSQKFTPVSG